MNKKLVFLGDSITQGLGDTLCKGWVGRLHDKSTTGDFYINLGVSGDTSLDIKHRLLSEVLYRNPDHLIIAAGINDTAYRLWLQNTDGIPQTKISLALSKETWMDIFTVAQAVVPMLTVIGLTPVHEALLPLQWMPHDEYDKGTDFKNTTIMHYNDMLHNLCKARNIRFIPIFEALHDHPDFLMNLDDGLHPNDKGYQIMADLIGGSNLNEGLQT
jgi:lysophospholipase L1-like esterase